MGEVGLVSSKVGEVGGYGVGVGKFDGGRGERGCFAKAGGREEGKMQSRLYLKLTSYIHSYLHTSKKRYFQLL